MTTLRRTVIGLAAALAAAGPRPSSCAFADDPPPTAAADPETNVRMVLQRGPPSLDVKEVRTWAAERAAEGRARRGTTFGGDLLAGAAAALAQLASERAAALALFVEAAGAYRVDDSGAGLAWYEIASLREDVGDAAGALEALDEGDRRARQPDVPDDSRWSQARRDALRAKAASTAPLLRAVAWLALGRFAEAADLYETLAERPPAGARADGLLEEAAAAAYRAGNVPRALRDIDRAISLSTSDVDVVTRTQWRLLAAHSMLDAKAEVSLASGWPGGTFVSDAEAAMRRLSGRRGAYRLAIQAASYAVVSKRPAEASDLFDLAFADPTFAEDARSDDRLVRMLMTAAAAMLAAGRPEGALERFRQAEALSGAPIAGMEKLRLDIEEAIAGARTKDGASPTGPDQARELRERSGQKTPGSRPPVVDPSAPRPGLSGPPSRDESDTTPASDGSSTTSSGTTWIWIVLGAVVLAAAGIAIAAVRRPRGPP